MHDEQVPYGRPETVGRSTADPGKTGTDHATRTIVSAAVIVAGITALVKIIGFVEKMLLAYYFGTGAAVDAYLIAFSVPFTIFILLREVIEPAFLPTFMACRDATGDREGWRLFSTLFNITAAALVAATAAGLLLTPQIVSVFAPGFDAERREMTIQLTRITLPASIFLGLSSLTYITLNAYKRFTVPVLGDLAFKGTAIVLLVVLHRALGIAGLALGIAVGAICRLLVHATGLVHERAHYEFRIDLGQEPLRRFGLLMLPLVLGIAFSQLSTIIDNVFASTLETGSVAALSYSRKVAEMPIVVLPYAMSVVLFPFFSERSIRGDESRLIELFMESLKILAIVFVPAAVGLVVLRTPLVGLLFERGAFTAESTLRTSSALGYYSLGIFFFAVEAVIVQFYFSMSDTRTPIAVGIICVLLNILVTAILIGPMRQNGIALALTISKTVKVLALYLLLKRKLPQIMLTRPLGYLARIAAASAAMGLSMVLVHSALSRSPSTTGWQGAARLAVAAPTGIAVFVAAAVALRIGELRRYASYLGKRLRRIA